MRRKKTPPEKPRALEGETSGILIEATHLFTVARWAADEADRNARTERMAASVAIVFSALSLEAFINEVGVLAGLSGTILADNPDEVYHFAAYWRKAEASGGSLEDKFDLAHFAFAGRYFDQGRQPYQDFALLVALRNEFAHLKPKDRILSWTANGIEVRANPIVKWLSDRKVINPREARTPTNWVTLVSTREGALWACNTAAAMVQHVLSLVPHCPFGKELGTIYGQTFRALKAGP